MGVKKRAKPKQISQEESDAVWKTIQENPTFSYRRVGGILGIAWTRVRAIAVKHGVFSRRPPLDAPTIGMLKRYRKQGYTLDRISQMTGISKCRVKKTLSQHAYTRKHLRQEIQQKIKMAIEYMERDNLTKAAAANRAGITYYQLAGHLRRRRQRSKNKGLPCQPHCLLGS